MVNTTLVLSISEQDFETPQHEQNNRLNLKMVIVQTTLNSEYCYLNIKYWWEELGWSSAVEMYTIVKLVCCSNVGYVKKQSNITIRLFKTQLYIDLIIVIWEEQLKKLKISMLMNIL